MFPLPPVSLVSEVGLGAESDERLGSLGEDNLARDDGRDLEPVATRWANVVRGASAVVLEPGTLARPLAVVSLRERLDAFDECQRLVQRHQLALEAMVRDLQDGTCLRVDRVRVSTCTTRTTRTEAANSHRLRKIKLADLHARATCLRDLSPILQMFLIVAAADAAMLAVARVDSERALELEDERLALDEGHWWRCALRAAHGQRDVRLEREAHRCCCPPCTTTTTTTNTMARQKLSPQAQRRASLSNWLLTSSQLTVYDRVNTIIITLPFVIATSWIMYKRMYLGEQPRTFANPTGSNGAVRGSDKVFAPPLGHIDDNDEHNESPRTTR